MSVTSRGLDLLKAGSRAFGDAARIIGATGPSPEVEVTLRGALRTLRSAMNWLEDTQHFETAHRRLDEAGKLARSTFPRGCDLTYEDGTYYQECPAALAHNRVGMSIGYVVRGAECSICHLDPEDCVHIKGRSYDGEQCFRIITDLDLLEVSFVGRPAQPDARIERVSVDRRTLQERLGEEFYPGVRVTCDKCLSTCDGVARPFEDPRLMHG